MLKKITGIIIIFFISADVFADPATDSLLAKLLALKSKEVAIVAKTRFKQLEGVLQTARSAVETARLVQRLADYQKAMSDGMECILNNDVIGDTIISGYKLFDDLDSRKIHDNYSVIYDEDYTFFIDRKKMSRSDIDNLFRSHIRRRNLNQIMMFKGAGTEEDSKKTLNNLNKNLQKINNASEKDLYKLICAGISDLGKLLNIQNSMIGSNIKNEGNKDQENVKKEIENIKREYQVIEIFQKPEPIKYNFARENYGSDTVKNNGGKK